MTTDQQKLRDIIQMHRKVSRANPQRDLKNLSENQRKMVERILDLQNLQERDRDAEWIVADIHLIGPTSSLTGKVKEVRRIQVIFKRQDRNQVKGLNRRKDGTVKTYHINDVLDVDEPPVLYLEPSQKKAKTGGKTKQKRSMSAGQLHINTDVNQPYQVQHNNNQGFQPFHGQQDHFAQQPMPPPPHHMPPQPMHQPPMHQQPIHQPPMHQPPMHQPQVHDPFLPPPHPQHYPQHENHHPQPHGPPPNARHSFSADMHPFTPNDEFMNPMFESPIEDRHGMPHPHQSARASSAGRSRRSSMRRPSGDNRRLSQIEDRMRQLTDKFEGLTAADTDSSDRSYEEEVFTPVEGQDWSPPSSPRSQFSDVRSRSERRRQYYPRDRRYPREKRYRGMEVDIIPEYSHHSSERGRFLPEPRSRRPTRPKLEHSRTIDDYPTGRAAEPRFLPPEAPFAPRPHMQRRLTDYEERWDNDDYDDDRRTRGGLERRDSRRDSRRSSTNDAYREQLYEPSTRDRPRGSRRQSYNAGDGGRGYYN